MEEVKIYKVLSLRDASCGATVRIDRATSPGHESWQVIYSGLHAQDCEHFVCDTMDKATALVILAHIMSIGVAEFDKRIGYAEMVAKAEEN